MSKYTITGRIEHIGATQEISEKFRKTEVIIETSNKMDWSNPVLIEFVNKAADIPSAFQVGDMVEIGFFVNGNHGKGRYEGRVFVALRGTEMGRIAASTHNGEQAQQAHSVATDADLGPDIDPDNLPF